MLIILGLVMLVIGALMVVFAQQVWDFTGAIDFVESKFPGNTKAFIQIVGVVLVIIGLLFLTGVGGFITQPIFDQVSHLFGQ